MTYRVILQSFLPVSLLDFRQRGIFRNSQHWVSSQISKGKRNKETKQEERKDRKERKEKRDKWEKTREKKEKNEKNEEDTNLHPLFALNLTAGGCCRTVVVVFVSLCLLSLASLLTDWFLHSLPLIHMTGRLFV